MQQPHGGSRWGAHSRKPRRSKNGTPEERAAKPGRPTDIVPMSRVPGHAHSSIDRRKLSESPLRRLVARSRSEQLWSERALRGYAIGAVDQVGERFSQGASYLAATVWIGTFRLSGKFANLANEAAAPIGQEAQPAAAANPR
jgi:hypothetical protein